MFGKKPNAYDELKSGIVSNVGREIAEDEDPHIRYNDTIPFLPRGSPPNVAIDQEFLQKLPMKWRLHWTRLDLEYIAQNYVLSDDEEGLIEKEETIEKRIENESRRQVDVVDMMKNKETLKDVSDEIMEEVEKKANTPVHVGQMSRKNKLNAMEIKLAEQKKDIEELGHSRPTRKPWNNKKEASS